MTSLDCLFCKIIAGEIPSKKVYEDHLALAFHDIHPKANTHILIIPKKHISTHSEMTEDDAPIMGHLMLVAKKIAEENGLLGYKLLMNVNREGGQVVFHVHLHLLSGRRIKLEEC